VFELPHPRMDGTTHLLLDPLERIEKLTLLISAPAFSNAGLSQRDRGARRGAGVRGGDDESAFGVPSLFGS
jgi:hypothetical protein